MISQLTVTCQVQSTTAMRIVGPGACVEQPPQRGWQDMVPYTSKTCHQSAANPQAEEREHTGVTREAMQQACGVVPLNALEVAEVPLPTCCSHRSQWK